MVRFGAVEKVEVPSRHRATAVVCVDSRHGDLARSRLCVRQFIAEQRRDDIVAGTVGQKYIGSAAAEADTRVLIFDIRVAFMHARPDEPIYERLPREVLEAHNCNERNP